jgi:hypothetical protein
MAEVELTRQAILEKASIVFAAVALEIVSLRGLTRQELSWFVDETNQLYITLCWSGYIDQSLLNRQYKRVSRYSFYKR